MSPTASEINGLTSHNEKVRDAQLPLSADGTEVLADRHVGVLEEEGYILVKHEPHGQLRGPLDDLGGVADVADENNRLGSREMEVLPRHGRLAVVPK